MNARNHVKSWPNMREKFAVLVKSPADHSAKPSSHLQISRPLTITAVLIEAFAVIVVAFCFALVAELA